MCQRYTAVTQSRNSRREPALLLAVTLRSLSLAIAASLAFAAPAGAAPWSPPREIAAPPAQTSHRPFPPGIAFNNEGRGAVAWITEEGEIGDRAAAAWARRGSDVFGPGVTARQAERVGASMTGNFALYGRKTIAFAGITGSERPAVAMTRLDALGGGRRIILLPDRRAASSVVAGNAAGGLAVATLATRRGGVVSQDRAPYVVVRRAGHGFGRPIRLARSAPRRVPSTWR
jgi:hypothetical protein